MKEKLKYISLLTFLEIHKNLKLILPYFLLYKFTFPLYKKREIFIL